MTPMKDFRFVWIDLETTGLNPDHDVILEMAMIITDGELNELVRLNEVVWNPYPVVFQETATMHPKVRKMHKDNGLLEAVMASEKDLRDVERAMFSLLHHHAVMGEARIAGSTIGFDRAFLRRRMPMFEGYLHYRSFDVSTLKEAARLWRPEFMPSKGVPAHRAMADIEESIASAKAFKELFELGVIRDPLDAKGDALDRGL